MQESVIRNMGKQIFTMRDVYSLSLMVNPEKQATRENRASSSLSGLFAGVRLLQKAVWKSSNFVCRREVNYVMFPLRTAEHCEMQSPCMCGQP